MINYLKWKIVKIDDKLFLVNDFFWIEVFYLWKKQEGEFFIFSYFDQNLKTFIYYCFEDLFKKNTFEKIIKIPWIGPKTAFLVSNLENLENIIKTWNIKALSHIHWIWNKTAKRIILELKWSIDFSDIENKIIKTLKKLWYNETEIYNKIKDCPYEINEENKEEIIKRLLKNI